MAKKKVKTKSVTRRSVKRTYGPYSQTYYFTKEKKRSAKPTIAGIFLILIGVTGLISALLVGAIGVMVATVGDEDSWFDHVKVSYLGQVTDVDGMPVEEAEVIIVDTDFSDTTDSDGRFIIMNLNMGITEVRVERSGYVTQQFPIFLNDNDNINHSQFEERKDDWEDGDYWDDYYTYDDDYYDDNEYIDEDDFDRNNNYYLIRLNAGTGFDQDDNIHFQKFRDGFSFITLTCFGILLISSLITLGGGILSVMRKGYGIAILGCITGVFSLAFPFSILFCVIAFFILVLSYDEFSNGRTRRPYKAKKKTITWKKYSPPPPYE